MDNSPLSKLPREIRDEIYTLSLQHDQTITICTSSTKDFAIRSQDVAPHTLALALTKTCKQIHHEALPLFFKTNSFVFFTCILGRYHPLADFREWISNTLNKHQTSAGSIEIHLGGIWNCRLSEEAAMRRFVENEIVELVKSATVPRIAWTVSVILDFKYGSRGRTIYLAQIPLLGASECIEQRIRKAAAGAKQGKETRPGIVRDHTRS